VTARDRRSAEHHVQPITERDVAGQGGGVLQHRLALAGERGLRDLQRRRVDQPGVGADGVALGQQQHVAGHDVLGRNVHLDAVTHDRTGRRRHALQGSDRLLRLGLLHEPQHGVGDEDHGDHHRLERDALGAVDDPDSERDGDCREQQEHERVDELGQQLAPGGHRRFRVDPVRTDPGETGRRLSGGEPPGHVGLQGRRHRRGVNQPCFDCRVDPCLARGTTSSDAHAPRAGSTCVKVTVFGSARSMSASSRSVRS
jgi:hypothetical protein